MSSIEEKNTGGFTLLEMIVAIGVFSVVMLVAAGSLLSIVSANRKAQAQKAVDFLRARAGQNDDVQNAA